MGEKCIFCTLELLKYQSDVNKYEKAKESKDEHKINISRDELVIDIDRLWTNNCISNASAEESKKALKWRESRSPKFFVEDIANFCQLEED
jgi:hypothetical protein